MPAPTRIAFCITELDPGGAERALVNLVTHLDRSEWSPRVFCLGPSAELVAPLEAADIPVECFGMTSPWHIGRVRSLSGALRRFDPALLQTMMFHANLLGRIAGRRAGVPIIIAGLRVAEHEKRWHLTLDRLTQRWVTHNVCVSRGVADFTIRHLGIATEKVTVIPNSVDADRFADAPPTDLSDAGIGNEARVLLFVGRLDRQKGVLDLLAATEPILQVDDALHLVLAGDGPLRQAVDEWITGKRLSDQVHALGRRDDVPGLLNRAEALILPSLWEGMPNVVLEAMASGCPVLASRVEGTSELIEDDVTGRLFSPGNPGEMRAVVEAHLEDREHSNRMAECSQHVVVESFTIERIVGDYVSLYRAHLADRHDGR